MSWVAILVLAGGAYAFKALGFLALSRVEIRGTFASVVSFVPAALFAGIIVSEAAASGSAELMVTRALGLVAGGVAVWRRAPLLVVIVVSAAVAALGRAVWPT